MASRKPEMIKDLSQELGEFIKSKSSTFACGGSIPVTHSSDSDRPSVGTIALRWDSPNSTNGISKLVFPIDNSKHGGNITKLIADCQPASFGYKGESVLDDTYRKATKMDRSDFSVDFCPYELGIIDTIAQMLLPNAGNHVGAQGVKAELYKLNIYGAPSGFFKAHVDTPRSETQFGSLVVSLPCQYVGGQLIVRHAGQSVVFDWGVPSGLDSKNVSWAAFYSDCEHEVSEVTEGHRITLTYNLYYVPGVGDLAGNSPVMDVTTLALYHKINAALGESTFMTKGGYLGVGCQHAYAHSTPKGISSLPGVLKGSDMAVYSVFKALGLDVTIRPVLQLDESGDGCSLVISVNEDHLDEDFIGHSLSELVITERGGNGDCPGQLILNEFGGSWMSVNWLTYPVHDEYNLAHATYGNEPGVNYFYSRAALIVKVPSAGER
ncbi:hypothetical protein P280DRAFT_436898 [Massarina eburnea CBS 473.64]|uniref:Fe2OG dioxygenase domain-containing protein n=1 Tax=Massarina eburnea CBS 473.64 TaxID=1395130 RepID=A0A6A6RNJ0_9PLEO|nr:hypothetical protein P280DRAFT_436898 [Massarina eburnea CBS 473.64]